jgi:superfamily II DNA or RNA helicase
MKATGVTGTLLDGVLTDDLKARWNARQELAVTRILRHFETSGFEQPYPLLAAATGFGKGRVIARVIEKLPELLGRNDHDPTLLIAGAKDLLVGHAISSVSGHLAASEEDALLDLARRRTGATTFSPLSSKGLDSNVDVHVGIWQGLAALERKPEVLPKFGLTVIDEVHNSGTEKRLALLGRISKDGVLGLTATAIRSSGLYRTPDSYGFEIVDSVSLPEGIQEGWNCPLLGVAIDPGYILPAEVREGSKLNVQKLARELRKHPEYLPNVARLLAEVFLKGVNGRPGPKAVIPVNRVDSEAVVIARILKKYGYSVGLAVNEIAAQKWAHEFPTFDAIERHKLHQDDLDAIQVLISPNVISEGYDNPAVELIAWVVPTLSAQRYTQVLGRGTRMCLGKAYCLVVDFPWFIEDFGYSTNLAQFFTKEEIKELEDGRYYIGPKDKVVPNLPKLPLLERYGRIKSILDLSRIDLTGWMTVESIMKKVEKSDRWVRNRIANYGGEKYAVYSPGTTRGTAGTYYPPHIIELIILEKEILGDAVDMATMKEMERVLGRNRRWILRRLDELGTQGEIRVMLLNGLTVPHYPRKVLAMLKKLSAKIKKVPRGYKNATELEVKLGCIKGVTLAAARTLKLGKIYPHPINGSDVRYFSPAEVKALKAEISKHPTANGWLSVTDLVKKTGRYKQFILKELRRQGIQGELRLSVKRHELAMHYPPDAVAKIPSLQDVPDAGDWLNLSQLSKVAGISTYRLGRILAGCGEFGEERRVTGKGTLIHYPPDVLKRNKII